MRILWADVVACSLLMIPLAAAMHLMTPTLFAQCKQKCFDDKTSNWNERAGAVVTHYSSSMDVCITFSNAVPADVPTCSIPKTMMTATGTAVPICAAIGERGLSPLPAGLGTPHEDSQDTACTADGKGSYE